MKAIFESKTDFILKEMSRYYTCLQCLQKKEDTNIKVIKFKEIADNKFEVTINPNLDEYLSIPEFMSPFRSNEYESKF